MATVSVPEKHVGAFKSILALPDADIDKLVSALQATPLTSDPGVALDSAVAQATSLSPSEARAVPAALLSLFIGAASSGKPTSAFVEDVVVAVETMAADEIGLSSEKRDLLKSRLTKVLRAEPLATSTRALSIQFEHLATFGRSRVASDIRPVFGESVDEPPKGAIISHTLNIHYYEGTDHKEFHVALDTEDLQALIDTLMRAQSKAKQLEGIINKMGIPFLGKG